MYTAWKGWLPRRNHRRRPEGVFSLFASSLLSIIVAIVVAGLATTGVAQERTSPPPPKPKPPVVATPLEPPPGVGQPTKAEFGSAQQLPQPDAKLAQSSNTREGKASSDWWLNRGLLLVGFLQLIVFGWQGYFLRRTVQVTERSQTVLEGPFIFPVIISTDIVDRFHPLMLYGETTSGSASPTVAFAFKNYGRTPAILRSVAFEVGHWTAMPERPRVDFLARPTASYVLPTDETTDTFERTIPAPIDNEAFRSISKSESFIFFFGEVVYVDIFENGCTMHFGLRWDYGGRRFVPLGEKYNYTERRHRL